MDYQILVNRIDAKITQRLSDVESGKINPRELDPQFKAVATSKAIDTLALSTMKACLLYGPEALGVALAELFLMGYEVGQEAKGVDELEKLFALPSDGKVQ